MNCFLWFEISENIWRWNRIICCKGFRCFSEIKLSYQIYQISPPPSPTWANIPQNCPSGDNFGKFFGGFDIVLKERGEGSNKVWFKCQDFTQSYPLGGFKVQSDKLCSKSSSFLRPKSPEGCNKSTPASVFTVLLRKKPCSLCFKYYNAIHPSNIVWDSKAFPFQGSSDSIHLHNSFWQPPLLKLIAEREYRGRSTSVPGRSVK